MSKKKIWNKKAFGVALMGDTSTQLSPVLCQVQFST